MPKAKWGSGNQALTAADIDGAETRAGFVPYSGPIPRSGLYRFTIKRMKQGTSSAGNPKLQIISELDGTWKTEHKKFEGCPLFDNMPVMKSTAFRVKAFCEAVGLSSKEFYNSIVVDENGVVTKLGSLGDPAGLLVYINAQYVAASDGYAEKLQLNGTGYLPVEDDEDDTEETTDEEQDAADDEAPF